MTPVVSSYFFSVVELAYGNNVACAFNKFMCAFVVIEIYLKLIHYNFRNRRGTRLIPVSYTHLDVYKRQRHTQMTYYSPICLSSANYTDCLALHSH